MLADPVTLVLAHGAGAGQRHPWMRRVVETFAAHGIRAVTFDFPYTAAGRRVPDRGPVLEAAFEAVWHETAAPARGRVFVGGKSMGGRIASQVAARGGFDPAPAGLIFFGYPLHPPGRPHQRRDRHLGRITVPMLFLHGTRDPFGSPDEMRALASGLSLATLHLVEGGDHSLVATRAADPAGESVQRAVEVAARWMLARNDP